MMRKATTAEQAKKGTLPAPGAGAKGYLAGSPVRQVPQGRRQFRPDLRAFSIRFQGRIFSSVTLSASVSRGRCG